MKFSEKFDKVIVGVISGLVFPLIVGLVIYAFTSGHQSIPAYLGRITHSDIVTHAISLCVFPNIIIFFLYNQFDMLRATRGVLAMTIVWAVIVFGVKLL
jgi:hypothetical protein